MLFDENYINFHNYGVPGTPILISGRYERRYANPTRASTSLTYAC